jgi:hypothetical protein
MSKFKSRVIGYISYIDKINLFCNEDACVVAGSEKAMLDYIVKANPNHKNELKVTKARYS